MLIANARFILAISNIETPVTGVLDAPVTANGVGETLHAHCETANVIANLDSLFSVPGALRYHHADRLQSFPQFKPGYGLWHRQLNVASRLLTPMPCLFGLMPTCIHTGEVVLALFVDIIDDRLVQSSLVS